MPERIGKYTINLLSGPAILGYAAVAGKKEGEGPLGNEFDYIYNDAAAGQNSWEKAESTMHSDAVRRAIAKAGKTPDDINIIFAGDLLPQCMGTNFGIRELNIPLSGVYGACSTMALSLANAAIWVDSSAADLAVASTSSHFCSAEKQFRMPLEYGGQRSPTCQWTATAAGAAVVGRGESGVVIEKAAIGRIIDLGIKDANNMGASMAPAAAATIADFLSDTGSAPSDYDMILTGDLGKIGSELLKDLLQKENGIDISAVHNDCGMMMFDANKQEDIYAGGSGCGCSGAIICSHILRRMNEGELNNVLFVGTGALLSSVSPLQSETVPGIAHAVLLRRKQ
ncbi:MAG: stage V sporulation protein AD [Clostridia bacterium]|nr:stage V sporulation protein AD [Clostridia bacterium]